MYCFTMVIFVHYGIFSRPDQKNGNGLYLKPHLRYNWRVPPPGDRGTDNNTIKV